MDILIMILCWIGVLILAWLCGKLITKIKMPAILGWLIAGMLLGPYGAGMLSQPVLDSGWYKIIIIWMQCAFGLMLGTELIWTKIESYGRALILTTLSQSLGTFAVVSVAFALVLHVTHQPVWLAPAFGGIALATAPAPALSIVQEFHTKGPVTDTLLPHSGVSLVFTGIVCSVLAASQPELSSLVKGTIAAAAVINEIIAVIAAKKGFELAGEIGGNAADA